MVIFHQTGDNFFRSINGDFQDQRVVASVSCQDFKEEMLKQGEHASETWDGLAGSMSPQTIDTWAGHCKIFQWLKMVKFIKFWGVPLNFQTGSCV